MSPTNTAAWLNGKGMPFEIKEAPYPVPAEHEIVVKNHAVSVQMVDWALQAMGNDLFPWIDFPTIIGGEVTGEVVETGPGVTRFKPGDRVVGLSLHLALNNAAHGAFQHYTLLRDHMAAPIPNELAYQDAAVIPLGLSTAASGLFQKHHLALQYPTVPATPAGQTVVIWSGASSVGCNAIQLAVAAGYEVVTTCSPRNFALVKGLGATHAFDYHSASVAADIVAVLKAAGKPCAGALQIGDGNAQLVVDIVDEAVDAIEGRGKGRRFVSLANPKPKDLVLPEGMGAEFIFGSDLWKNEVGVKVWQEYLGEALRAGAFVPAPPAEVVGSGLESVEKAFAIGMKGVSAKKLVVLLCGS